MNILIWSVIRKLRLGAFLLFVHRKSALKELGWFVSFNRRQSVDKLGKPIPWWTYGFNAFLEPRLNNSLRVLEFGCGGSTIWLGARVGEVVSIENHVQWANQIKAKSSGNVIIRLVERITDFDSYIKSVHGVFQVVVVDCLGDRIECAKQSLALLADDGVVIWDNTDGPDWNTINGMMQSHGFREISFTGMTPQEVALGRTTVFYRSQNCLGI